MIKNLKKDFPQFYKSLKKKNDIENELSPLSDQEIENLEKKLKISLPGSYKKFLKCTRGFCLMGGVIQFAEQHPFFHNFQSFDKLTEQQKIIVKQRGGNWPPPSQGMLCFAEFFMEADGDQVLFDVQNGLINGEYSVMYYAHSDNPPTVRKLADSFEQFMNEFLDYDEFNEED